MPQAMSEQYPSFDDLPLRKGDPQYSAWGLWGENDQLGTLNHLTPEVVKAASSEIRTGKRFSLNWSLDLPKTPGFHRSTQPFKHELLGNPYILSFDDAITFNTQRSSQWDGLRHFGYQKEQVFYMGTTTEDVLKDPCGRLGLQNWHSVGGIAGRGILIDWWSWAEKNAMTADMSEDVAISFDGLMSCFEAQQMISAQPLEIRPGDIILIRSGFTQQYMKLDEVREMAVGNASPMKTCGVQQDRRLLEWLWKHRIAAVGGDMQGFECFPPDTRSSFLMHEVLLAGWGCPIAELLYLEDLAAFCKKEHVWSFLLSSSPLNVPGGVASPANMMVIL